MAEESDRSSLIVLWNKKDGFVCMFKHTLTGYFDTGPGCKAAVLNKGIQNLQ